MSNIKNAVLSIQALNEKSGLIDYLRPWLVITDLELQDALALSFDDLREGLERIYSKLSDSCDIFDEDQLQEAACRCLGTIVMQGELMEDAEVRHRTSFKAEWNGNHWFYITDPRLRQRVETKSYAEVRRAGLEYLGR